jgi:hypothetical protein
MIAKRCTRCCVAKPLTKFHSAGHAECKVCHNGTTAWNLRRSAMLQDRMPKEPDEEQIALACLVIQKQWSKKKRASRKIGRVPL